MTAAAEEPAALSLPAQAWSVAIFEMRRLVRARHALTRFAVLFIPLLMAAVVAAVHVAFGTTSASGDIEIGRRTVDMAADQRALALLFRMGELRWIVFLAAAGLFGGLFSGERAERTLHHVFLQPLRREALTAGKFIAGVLLMWPLALVAWLLTTITWLAPHGLGAALGAILSLQGLGDLLAYAAALLLAIVAYGGIFLAAGALIKSPPLVALGLLAWELLSSVLPTSFQRFTVFYWLDSMLPMRVPVDAPLAVLADAAPWPLAVLVCLLIGAAGVAAAAWRARSMELAYGASD